MLGDNGLAWVSTPPLMYPRTIIADIYRRVISCPCERVSIPPQQVRLMREDMHHCLFGVHQAHCRHECMYPVRHHEGRHVQAANIPCRRSSSFMVPITNALYPSSIQRYCSQSTETSGRVTLRGEEVFRLLAEGNGRFGSSSAFFASPPPVPQK